MKTISTIIIFVLASGHCFAQDQPQGASEIYTAPWFVEKFRVTAGFFMPVSSSTARVEIKGGSGSTNIDFEKDLGLSSNNVTFLGSVQWRIARHSRVNFNYYNIPRSRTSTLNRDIIFNGQTYPLNASVNSYFNTAIYQVSYGYAILAKPEFELGVLIGTHLVGGSAGISLNNPNGTISGNTDFGFTAPLPDLGLWGGYAFNKRLAANFEASYLSLTVGDVSGSILSYNIMFLYRVIEKLDVSLGYSGLNVTVDITKTNGEGNFKWGYSGPALGVTYSFGKSPWTH